MNFGFRKGADSIKLQDIFNFQALMGFLKRRWYVALLALYFFYYYLTRDPFGVNATGTQAFIGVGLSFILGQYLLERGMGSSYKWFTPILTLLLYRVGIWIGMFAAFPVVMLLGNTLIAVWIGLSLAYIISIFLPLILISDKRLTLKDALMVSVAHFIGLIILWGYNALLNPAFKEALPPLEAPKNIDLGLI